MCTEARVEFMKKLYRFLLRALNSWVSVVFVVVYCLVNFYFGQRYNDMNLFAASGAVMTVFGLFSMIRFTTIEKYLNQVAIATASTGVTGPPLSAEDSKKLVKQNQEKARVRLQRELRSELKGITFTITGTLIWAYGVYVPVFHWFSI
jgi:membrane protein YdbS with pleckstrin-like domain